MEVMRINGFVRSAVVMLILLCSINGYSYPKLPKVLIFSKTAGFRHGAAIAAGIKAIQQMGRENNFEADATEDAGLLTPENLKQYKAVVFLCTTGDILNAQQQYAFENYIRSGGGFIGTHSAADTEYDWPWYGELVGAYFKNHPSGQQFAMCQVVNRNHISTSHLPPVWKKKDELYNFKWIGLDLNILITIDENSYKGGENGAIHPMSWFHEFSGGRAFYTAFGHDEKSFEDPLYIKHLLGGIQYAMGNKGKTH